MTREEGLELVKIMLQNQNLVKHCLAVEAIMRAVCRELRDCHPELIASHPRPDRGSSLDSRLRGNDNDNIVNEFDVEEWGLVGLLHDADYEITNKDLETHTDIIVEKIKEMGGSERLINGVLAHHDLKKPERENYLEKAVYATDELSGLITACALVRPDKKLASLSVDSVMKKFKQKEFAAGAKRHQILKCEEELGIPLQEFVAIALSAMQNISDDLGL
ncbi:MAG: HD domain-containing protein [Candidatus Daviesbacteria bacterium]|nr:HD domain-containing protein [Candidatus Daviesbacteria bacterium]